MNCSCKRITCLCLLFGASIFPGCENRNVINVSNDTCFSLISSEESNIDFINRLTETVDHKFIITEYFFNGGGLAVGDINNDGDLDLIAGNLGNSYKYKASITMPFEVYASDFDNNSNIDIILSFHEKGEVYPLRGRECSSEQMPYIKQKFTSYEAFGTATIEDIVGKEKIKTAVNLKAKTFNTTYFENIDNKEFLYKTLPPLAQLSSVNDIKIDDSSRDENLDLVLAGNLYTAEVETPRNDASYGVFLSGDGQGNFKAFFPYQSGLYLDGDVKELALIHSGRSKYLLGARNNDKLACIINID